MEFTKEYLTERTKGLTAWEDLRKVYVEIGAITPADIANDKIFSAAEGILIDKHERGEITDLEFNRMSIELDHEHTRSCVQRYDEESTLAGKPVQKCEWDFWLDELDEIIAQRNAGKITDDEYWHKCFDLDKKYYFADDDDGHLYFN
ncbi:MAG: hypothetical protein IJU91_02780 [Selenomonadaceae bacterium]|nr:hypothetical protein [Selenomonadaceae bacterium]